jgi:hypothetical protein
MMICHAISVDEDSLYDCGVLAHKKSHTSDELTKSTQQYLRHTAVPVQVKCTLTVAPTGTQSFMLATTLQAPCSVCSAIHMPLSTTI